MFGGLLEKIAIGGYIFGGYWFTRYDYHGFCGSWCNIGGFNIGSVTGNPPNTYNSPPIFPAIR